MCYYKVNIFQNNIYYVSTIVVTPCRPSIGAQIPIVYTTHGPFKAFPVSILLWRFHRPSRWDTSTEQTIYTQVLTYVWYVIYIIYLCIQVLIQNNLYILLYQVNNIILCRWCAVQRQNRVLRTFADLYRTFPSYEQFFLFLSQVTPPNLFHISVLELHDVILSRKRFFTKKRIRYTHTHPIEFHSRSFNRMLALTTRLRAWVCIDVWHHCFPKQSGLSFPQSVCT